MPNNPADAMDTYPGPWALSPRPPARDDDMNREQLNGQLSDLGLDPTLYDGIPEDVLRRIVAGLYGETFAAAARKKFAAPVVGTAPFRLGDPPADVLCPGVQLFKPAGEPNPKQTFSAHTPTRPPTMPRTLSKLQQAMLRPGGLLARQSPKTTAAIRTSAGMSTVPTAATMTFSAHTPKPGSRSFSAHTPKPGSRSFSPLQRRMIRAGGVLDQVSPQTTARLRIAAGR